MIAEPGAEPHLPLRANPRIAPHRKVYRFGVFELATDSGELRKNGARIKLQIKPLQILQTLLERPGEVITRAELCEILWPPGTFVDFESGLNTALNRLRAALGDSVGSPRYIETLPRLGYRFICPVTIVEIPNAGNVSVPAPHPIQRVAQAPAERSNRDSTGIVRRRPRFLMLITGGALIVIAAVVVIVLAVSRLSSSSSHPSRPALHPLTFQPVVIGAARLSAASNYAIYSDRKFGQRWQLHRLDLSTLKSDALNVAGRLLAISDTGRVATVHKYTDNGTVKLGLYISDLPGNNERLVSSDIMAADFLPGGETLAVVRDIGTQAVVEFPIGHPVFNTEGRIDALRVSGKGMRIAFLHHPTRDDTAGEVMVADRFGKAKVLSDGWSSVAGLSWSPSGGDVYFTASKEGVRGVLYAISQSGVLRQVSNNPTSVRLLDIGKSGKVLIAAEEPRESLLMSVGREKGDNDISIGDSSHADAISRDGKVLLFTVSGDAGGRHYETYLYNRLSGQKIPVTPGRALDLSDDGKEVLTMDPQDRKSLQITFVATHRTETVSGGGLVYQWAQFVGNGTRLIVGGAQPGEHLALYLQDVPSGQPQRLSALPYEDHVMTSPDGSLIAGVSGADLVVAKTSDGSIVRRLPNAYLVRWSADGRVVYGFRPSGSTLQILRLTLPTGDTGIVKTMTARYVQDFDCFSGVVAAPESNTYAYSELATSSRLYGVDGWLN